MVCTALDQCQHVSVVHAKRSRDVADLDIVCVIGQGRLSRPIIGLRSRSDAFKMFENVSPQL